MSLQVRRVVTGDDHNGHATVEIDEIAQNVINNRPGHHLQCGVIQPRLSRQQQWL